VIARSERRGQRIVDNRDAVASERDDLAGLQRRQR